MDDFLSVDEARTAFKVSRQTIFRMIRAGKLTAYKREGDRRTLLNRAELARLFTPRPRRPDQDRPAPPG